MMRERKGVWGEGRGKKTSASEMVSSPSLPPARPPREARRTAFVQLHDNVRPAHQNFIKIFLHKFSQTYCNFAKSML